MQGDYRNVDTDHLRLISYVLSQDILFNHTEISKRSNLADQEKRIVMAIEHELERREAK